jgi:hypothetical protein
MNKKTEIKNNEPLWRVTISAEKVIAKKQTFNFYTVYSSSSLNSAFRVAQAKAKKMKLDDPEHNDYIVTDIRIK